MNNITYKTNSNGLSSLKKCRHTATANRKHSINSRCLDPTVPAVKQVLVDQVVKNQMIKDLALKQQDINYFKYDEERERKTKVYNEEREAILANINNSKGIKKFRLLVHEFKWDSHSVISDYFPVIGNAFLALKLVGILMLTAVFVMSGCLAINSIMSSNEHNAIVDYIENPENSLVLKDGTLLAVREHNISNFRYTSKQDDSTKQFIFTFEVRNGDNYTAKKISICSDTFKIVRNNDYLPCIAKVINKKQLLWNTFFTYGEYVIILPEQ